jgi:uncharacterized protein (DUF433 family)
MFMNKKELLKRIKKDPKVMVGKPVIKGTRIPVEMIIEKLAYGSTEEDLLQSYPCLNKNDIKAALLYAAKRLALEKNHVA